MSAKRKRFNCQVDNGDYILVGASPRVEGSVVVAGYSVGGGEGGGAILNESQVIELIGHLYQSLKDARS